MSWRRVGVWGLLALGSVSGGVVAGCCQQPSGAALVVNVADSPLQAWFDGHESDRTTVEPGDAKVIGTGQAGATSLHLERPGQAAKAVALEVRQQEIAVVSEEGCVALADYSAQYGKGGGPVKVMVTAGPGQPAWLPPADFRMVRGPNQPLPADITANMSVVRLTHVPCELLGEPERLEDHLARMD